MTDTRRALLDALAAGPVSGPALADSLGVSRAAVWKQVEALRGEGFGIESDGSGYRIASLPEYGGAAIEYGLDAPYAVEYHDSIGSTNDRARELAAEGAADVAVVADEQTGSRGRLDRPWSSPAGGVWLSLVLRPSRPPSHVPAFTLAAAVATTRAAREVGVDAGIKWPNDVLVSETSEGTPEAESGGVLVSDANEGKSEANSDRVLVSETSEGTPEAESGGVLVSDANGGKSDVKSGEKEAFSDRGGRKLAGVLTEMEGEADRVSWLVVGVGVNANVDAADLPARATSLLEERGEPVDRRAFVQRLLSELHRLRERPEEVLPAWREHALTLGRRVRVDTPGGTIEGEAIDVEFPGALVVRTSEGEETVYAGDCEHLRPA
ncbi:biotin--[acetyl-CoA-carboxylase] ligase [Halegenticoccus tardaugens]|uniref:biotin--[acetyl-CoA-carboxylase] ligase n=1 Tax=Halegenticoccus tardaugens TaxID=2071624 RepID=UPI00100BB0FA|nr:biotin--[acetyl-CoA-carboxylase] ligase [Halegenticoccus tardaugens]